MDNVQFGILISAIVTVAGALGTGFRSLFRWAVKQIVDVLRDNEQALKANTTAMLEYKAATQMFYTKLEEMFKKVDEMHDWMEENTPVETPSKGRYRNHKRGDTKS